NYPSISDLECHIFFFLFQCYLLGPSIPVNIHVFMLFLLQRQNIPKDYKIPVRYIPKEEGGMCWVKLSVFYLEDSLKDLSHKFGNISSNRKDISIFIQMLQEVRLYMEPPDMYDFLCHYRKERWPTARYFDYVEDFLIAAQDRQDSADCDPPPCPTTPYAITTATDYTTGQFMGKIKFKKNVCFYLSGNEPLRFLPEVVERSLLSLLFIPVAALVFLLVWKVRSRRNQEELQNPGEGGLFTGTEGTAPPLDAEISEK
uniref:Kit ligand n=1 Tax=Myripristis murdjan TaxID=586833 RepID=A0A667Y0M8_9TELE